MKISIIDIGTQSVKHSIYEARGVNKTLLHYKRYSDAKLGEGEIISPEAIERNIGLLAECLELNKKEGVEALKVLGTAGLRNAKNASDFILVAEKLLNSKIEIISHIKEAAYLFEGFVSLTPSNLTFGAVNVGGGSTEFVWGQGNKMAGDKKFAFGVKALRTNFVNADGQVNWQGLDSYLEQNLVIDKLNIDDLFITGVLSFISSICEAYKINFLDSGFANHPIKFSLNEYYNLVQKLRATPVAELKKIYTKDPGFCENVAIGQSLYLAVAKKVNAQFVIPSNNDLTDGVIQEMLKLNALDNFNQI